MTTPSQSSPSTSPLLGKPAPAFALPDQSGKTRSLQEFLGKTIVLYFYPKDDTPGCTREACSFRDLLPALSRQNVVVLGMSADSSESHARFADKYQLPFPLLADRTKATLKAYHAWGKKILYGKEHEGILRSTVVIDPKGTIIRHWRKVAKAETHPSDVATFLNTSTTG